MREIKFRAWDERNKKHIYGDPSGWFFNGDGCYLEYGLQANLNNETEDFILEQYTGLKDKNGKEIYEGDIVKIHVSLNNFIIKEVYYDVDLCEFGFRNTFENLYSMYGEYFEIIGNINENKELINAAL